jgi:hypothetical protein
VTLAELLRLRTSVIWPNASAVTVIRYSSRRPRMSHSTMTWISPPRAASRGYIGDPQFLVDFGAAYPEPRGGPVGKGVPLVGAMADNSATYGTSSAPHQQSAMGVAYFYQAHDQVGS